ncbi:hypothetical protein BQ8794_190004 [Mesorhizobium prunaredense]|uniref:Arginase n=1 Tax=Mesorhizobium prunaredense TaxID=1631249 RepID=A0A1R3V4W9_9HYPH|nr:hypothetical protein BQ8794_190004 [Mesorhizobium prunaredense]
MTAMAPDAAPASLAGVFGNVEVVVIDDADEPTAANTGGDYRLLPVGDQMSRILVQNIRLAETVQVARKAGRIPIASIGACSASLGMVGGIADAEGDVGMIWFDAHGDAKTPDTSESGFFEGMPVTTIAGKCWPRYRRKIPGFREIPEERIITVSLSEMSRPRRRVPPDGGRSRRRVRPSAANRLAVARPMPPVTTAIFPSSLRAMICLLAGETNLGGWIILRNRKA